jgi:hypothetical protein
MYKPKPTFFRTVTALLRRVNMHFREINYSGGYTDADKTRLKEFYLEHLVAPKARKLLEKYFPDEFGQPAASPDLQPKTGPASAARKP